MSGQKVPEDFTENPFADPFADPAIDQVTNVQTTAAASSGPTQINLQGSSTINVAPAPLATQATTTNQLQGARQTNGTTSTGQSVAIDMNDPKTIQQELERRQAELEVKAAELAAREEALRSSNFQRQHNWPPLPSFCPIQPCFYQDISVDIQPEFQSVVEFGYKLWMAFVGALLVNLLGALTILANGVSGSGSNFTFGLFSILFFAPLSYISWFRPLYRAFKKDSSFNFMVFFFTFFLQTFFTSLWSIGIPTDGPCGLWLALSQMGNGFIVSILLLLVTACWAAYAGCSAWYLLRVHRIYRSTGASLAKARSEFAEGIIRNQYVQQTVATAARQTVNQTFASAMGSSASNQPAAAPAGVRY